MRLGLVVLAFVAGTLSSRMLLAAVPARFTLDLAQPLPVVTWWGDAALPFLAVLFITLAVAGAIYAFALRSKTPPLGTTLTVAACAALAGLFWLPLFSSDTYAYAAYGQMLQLGLNPYAHGSTLAGSTLVTAARWQWSGTLPICVYGPVFVAIAGALVTFGAAFGSFGQIEIFRVLACAAFVVCAFFLARAGSSEDDERGRRAALVFALNPVLLWSAIEGHNDFEMLAVVLGGIVLWRRHAFAGACLATLAATIKAPGIVAGPALAFAAAPRRFAATCGGAASGIAVAFICALPLLEAMRSDLAPHGRYAPLASVQSLHPLVAVVPAVFALLALRNVTTTVDRLLAIALVAWLAIPNPYPWYGAWLIPLAAWARDGALARTALFVSAATLLRYVPDAVSIPSHGATVLLGIAALAAYGPLFRRGIIVRS